MLSSSTVSRLGRLALSFVLITTAWVAMPGPTVNADPVNTTIDLNHVDLVAHLDVSGTMEVERLLASDAGNLGFFAANRPGTQPYDGGWAIVDLDQLSAGAETAVMMFQPAPVYYEAGGVTSSGHFAALREDARIWAENNRNDIVVYDVSNPAEPTLFGEFALDKPDEVWRNTIYDMVVHGDRAYLLAVVHGTIPNFDFRGIIVVDLSSPDPDTNQLPEVARYAHPITMPLLSSGNKLYAATDDGTIYVFDLDPDFRLAGTYPAGDDLILDMAYGGGVIGRIDNQPTLIDFAAGSAGSPDVKPIYGEPFTAKSTSGDLLWGPGRDHDTVVVWPETTSEFVFGFTVGSVDGIDGRADDVLTAPMAEDDFLLVDWTDLYRLRQDGWRPHTELLAVEPGLEVNGQPLPPGERVTIESGSELACQLSAPTHAGKDNMLTAAGSAVDGACESALAAVCADGDAAVELFTIAAVLQANTYCTYLENHISDSYEDCIEPAVFQYMYLYWYALSLLCGASPVAPLTSTMAATDDDAALRFSLTEGGYTVAGDVEGMVYALETPHATVSVTGRGGIEAFVYLPAEASVFVATDSLLTVTPNNRTLAAFTLEPGEIVGVTVNEILPVGSSTHAIYLPMVIH